MKLSFISSQSTQMLGRYDLSEVYKALGVSWSPNLQDVTRRLFKMEVLPPFDDAKS